MLSFSRCKVKIILNLVEWRTSIDYCIDSLINILGDSWEIRLPNFRYYTHSKANSSALTKKIKTTTEQLLLIQCYDTLRTINQHSSVKAAPYETTCFDIWYKSNHGGDLSNWSCWFKSGFQSTDINELSADVTKRKTKRRERKKGKGTIGRTGRVSRKCGPGVIYPRESTNAVHLKHVKRIDLFFHSSIQRPGFLPIIGKLM